MKAVKGHTGVRLVSVSQAHTLDRESNGLVDGLWRPTDVYNIMHPTGHIFIRNDVCNSQLFILLFEE